MGRSGGTLLGRIMGNSPEAIYVGELRYFWEKGIINNYECSCNSKFENCIFWTQVVNEYKNHVRLDNIEKIRSELEQFERLKNFSKLKDIKKNGNLDNRLLSKYLFLNEKLYESIINISNKNIIVESSRIPGRLFALSLSDKFDLFPIHLIRDPRGVMNSLINQDLRNYGYAKHGDLRRILEWNFNNLYSLKIMKELNPDQNFFIWYKNFVQFPSRVLKDLEKFLGYNFDFKDDNGIVSVDLDAGHIFSGNESRFKTGIIKVSEDIKWKEQLNMRKKLVISAATLPLFKFIIKKYHSTPDNVNNNINLVNK